MQTNHRQGAAEFGLRCPLLITAEISLDMHGQCVWRTAEVPLDMHGQCVWRAGEVPLDMHGQCVWRTGEVPQEKGLARLVKTSFGYKWAHMLGCQQSSRLIPRPFPSVWE